MCVEEIILCHKPPTSLTLHTHTHIHTQKYTHTHTHTHAHTHTPPQSLFCECRRQFPIFNLILAAAPGGRVLAPSASLPTDTSPVPAPSASIFCGIGTRNPSLLFWFHSDAHF